MFFLISLLFGFPSAPQAAETHELVLGKPVARVISGGETQTYLIDLNAGELMLFVVDQQGVNVVVRLYAPSGEKAAETDNPSLTYGKKRLFYITNTQGRHRLEVTPSPETVSPGRYEVELTERRPVREYDAALMEAESRMSEVEDLYFENRYAEAAEIAERILEAREKALGAEHPETAAAMSVLANLRRQQGDYAAAETLCLRALAVAEKACGPQHPRVAALLGSLASLYLFKGNLAAAEPLLKRALAIQERIFTAAHPDLAASLHNLADLYARQGDYLKAESFEHRALSVWEKALGAEHRSIALALARLALISSHRGDYAKSELLYRRALAIQEKVFGSEHPDIAATLNSLAVLYKNKGDFSKAEPLYRRALSIRKKILGDEHPEVAVSLNNLGLVCFYLNDFDKAEALFQEALTITESRLGGENREVAATLVNLAALYSQKRDFGKAETFHLRALSILEKTSGEERDVAVLLHNLAGLHFLKGEYDKAEKLYQRALSIREKIFGDEHPQTANTVSRLAELSEAQGNIDQAIALRIRCNDIRERTFTRNLMTGSERQKLSFLNLSAREHDETLSLHLLASPTNANLGRAALTSILRRKGRALDAMTSSLDDVRRQAYPEDREMLAELVRANSRLTHLTLRGQGPEGFQNHQARVRKLEAGIDDLEARISSRGVEYGTRTAQPVTLEAVQRAVPSDAVLVEFSTYRPYSPKTEEFGNRRYGVYLLRSTGDPAWADLGDAEAVDRLVAEFRRTLQAPGSHRKLTHHAPGRSTAAALQTTNRLAARLYAAVLKPLEPHLGNVSRVLLSPDGTLNLVPFAALADEKGTYLVERYSLTYLTSGRDLLRLRDKTPSEGKPLVLADPDYGDGEGPFLLGRQYEPLRRLRETEREGRQIGNLLPDAVVRTRGEATKRMLEVVCRPSVLHIATHGFFLSDEKTSDLSDADRRKLVHTGELPPVDIERIRRANPLLRSYLFLAGANKTDTGAEEGILTALEAAALDLRGTKLVVLSACDTGVGDVRNGEGVYGLRRALVLAGSETQVMSLWSVSDAATRSFMIRYYQGLKRGEGRADALRNVQLDVLRDPKRRHPYFWAGFIQSGEWAVMADLYLTPKREKP